MNFRTGHLALCSGCPQMISLSWVPHVSSQRRPLRDGSWDFGTGTVHTTGTLRSKNLCDNEDHSPSGSETLPSLLSKAELDFQIDAGLRDAGVDIVGSRRESSLLRKGPETDMYSHRNQVIPC